MDSNKRKPITEKPSQASAYTEAFDEVKRKKGYYVVSNNQFKEAIITYGFGHLVNLCSPEDYDKELRKWDLNTLPILPNPFKFRLCLITMLKLA